MPRVAIVAAWLAVLVAGCATVPAPRSGFEDIPVPKGLTYLEDRSTVIESPSVKAARLLYRGRLEITSLGVAMRTTLETNGWRHVSTAGTEGRGAIHVYEKGGNSLQVRLWEGWWFTYVELTASRALVAPSR